MRLNIEEEIVVDTTSASREPKALNRRNDRMYLMLEEE